MWGQYIIKALHKVGVAVGEARGGKDAEGDGAAHAIEDAPVVRVRLERLDTRARHGVECLLLCAAGVAPQRAVPGVQEVARTSAVPQEQDGCTATWATSSAKNSAPVMMHIYARHMLHHKSLSGGGDT